MSRITWQNVAAPDFSAAIRGVGNAGELFNKAASQFSGSMDGIAQRGRRDASKGAMEAALAYTDVAGWERAMAEQGLGALGINPQQATDELMGFVTGRRDDLAGYAADDAGLAQDAQRLRESQYGFERTQLNDQRADEALVEGEADEQLRLQVLQDAQRVADSTTTREEAMRQITTGVEDPVVERLMLEALDTMPSNQWAADPTFQETAVLDTDFGNVSKALSYRDSQLVMDQANNPTLALYAESLQGASGYASPMDGMIDRLNAKIDPNDPDSEGMIGRSSGELARVYNNMAKEFPNVPKSMIAAVIENSLEETGMGWIADNELKPDMSRVRDQLNLVNTPEQLTMLEQERNEIERRTAENREIRQAYDRAVHDFELANSRGDQAGVANARQSVQAVAEMLKADMIQMGESEAAAEKAAAELIAEAEAAANPENGNRLNSIPGLDQPLNFGAMLDGAAAPFNRAPMRPNTAPAPVVNGRMSPATLETLGGTPANSGEDDLIRYIQSLQGLGAQ